MQTAVTNRQPVKPDLHEFFLGGFTFAHAAAPTAAATITTSTGLGGGGFAFGLRAANGQAKSVRFDVPSTAASASLTTTQSSLASLLSQGTSGLNSCIVVLRT